MAKIREKSWLTVILVIGFLVRSMICFFSRLPNMHHDSWEYYDQATALLSGSYTNYFPNGYPLIIAISRVIAGTHYQTFLLWTNIALSTLCIGFVYDIGKRVFNSPVTGLLAATILAILPSQINYVRWLTTEVPTAFFLLGAYFYYYRAQHFRSGIFFALAIFVRTNIAPIPLLLLAILAIREKRIPWRLAIGSALPLLAVCTYCYWKTGEFTIAGNNQINIVYSITAKGGYVDFQYNEKHPELDTSPKAINAYLDHMKEDPAEFISQKCANCWELWGFYPSTVRGTRGTASRLLIGMGNFFMVVFGLAGWWFNRRLLAARLLMLPFITVTLIHTILFALTRYTYPVEPFMVLLASNATIKIKEKWAVRTTP
ncbi:MAG TPA: glycosyltransferase family 39 protein [Puia sp.]|nr:glycosyltransferase family 39 protein [Puia sp.]